MSPQREVLPLVLASLMWACIVIVGLVSFKSRAVWSAVSTDISWNRVYEVCRRNLVLHVVHCKLHRNGLLSPPTLIQQLQVSAMSYMQLVHNQRGFRPNTCGLLATCLAECNPR